MAQMSLAQTPIPPPSSHPRSFTFNKNVNSPSSPSSSSSSPSKSKSKSKSAKSSSPHASSSSLPPLPSLTVTIRPHAPLTPYLSSLILSHLLTNPSQTAATTLRTPYQTYSLSYAIPTTHALHPSTSIASSSPSHPPLAVSRVSAILGLLSPPSSGGVLVRGRGSTTLLKAFASQSDAPYLSAVGLGTSALVRSAFARARVVDGVPGRVVVIDDLHRVAGVRGRGAGGKDAVASTFLAMFTGDVKVLAAKGEGEELDPAAVRSGRVDGVYDIAWGDVELAKAWDEECERVLGRRVESVRPRKGWTVEDVVKCVGKAARKRAMEGLAGQATDDDVRRAVEGWRPVALQVGGAKEVRRVGGGG